MQLSSCLAQPWTSSKVPSLGNSLTIELLPPKSAITRPPMETRPLSEIVMFQRSYYYIKVRQTCSFSSFKLDIQLLPCDLFLLMSSMFLAENPPRSHYCKPRRIATYRSKPESDYKPFSASPLSPFCTVLWLLLTTRRGPTGGNHNSGAVTIYIRCQARVKPSLDTNMTCISPETFLSTQITLFTIVQRKNITARSSNCSTPCRQNSIT